MLPLPVQLETQRLAMLLGVILLLSSELHFLEPHCNALKTCPSAWGEVVASAAEGEEIVYAEVRFLDTSLLLS